MSAAPSTMRNTLMMLGAYCVAAWVNPLVEWLLINGLGGLSSLAFVAAVALAVIVAFLLAGALLSAAIDSDRKLAWAAGAGGVQSLVALYWTTTLSSIEGAMSGIEVGLLVARVLLPPAAAVVGCVIARAWYARRGKGA